LCRFRNELRDFGHHFQQFLKLDERGIKQTAFPQALTVADSGPDDVVSGNGVFRFDAKAFAPG